MTHAHPIYDTNKRFVIDAATKNIAISDTNKPVLVQYDNYSEVITFEIDRYVEGHDLSLSNKVEVHYNNIDTTGRRTSRGLYPVEDFKADPDNPAKVLVRWFVSEEATKYEGTLNFVVSFSCLEDDVYNVYRWNSHIGTLQVSAGINNTEYLEQNYADVLEMWKQDLFGIGDTEEARMLALSEQLRNGMEIHAAQVTASMPEEYLDYSAFEKSKANVKDINRLLENDLVKSRATNYYPYGDSSFEYDGVKTYQGVSAAGSFYLEEGTYYFVVTDTNAVGIYVMLNDGSDTRLLAIKDNHIGFHQLIVSAEYANKPLVVKFYASAATANEAGTYYLKRPYIFDMTNRGILADDFFIKAPAKMLESDLVKSQVGENLYTGGDIEFYYDGIQTFKGKESSTFTLDEGNYTITVLDSNAIFFVMYIAPATSSAVRIFAVEGPLEEYKFTIPSEYANIPLSFFGSASLSTPNEAGDYYVRSVYIYKDDGTPYLPDFFTKNILRAGVLNKLSGPAFKAENGSLSVTSDALVSNATMTIDAVCDVKTNKSLVFTAKFGTFNGLRLGHGKTSYGGSYLEISNNAIDIYQYTNSAARSSTHAHGLTFSEFITVVVNVGVSKANVTIFTATGSYTASDVNWGGCNGNIFAESINTSFTDCEMKWTPAGVKDRVWVFGDSYLGFNSNRWPGQMHNLGYKNWLASGFPGGKSSYELATFKTLLTLGTPDIVIWCMGMNDGDGGAVNNNWLTCVNELLVLCHDKNIIPILATIPTCPEVNNIHKNEWIRNSGYRYIDFNKAVGVNGTSWYDGMLSGDEIHPTELGAKALAARVCIDAPEIMQ